MTGHEPFEKLLKNRLSDTMVRHGFLDAAENLQDVVRGCTTRMIQDKIELWKAWDNKTQWFEYADRISIKDWHGRFQQLQTEDLRDGRSH